MICHKVFLGPHKIQIDFQMFLELWQHGAMTASLGSLFHALVKSFFLTPSLTALCHSSTPFPWVLLLVTTERRHHTHTHLNSLRFTQTAAQNTMVENEVSIC